MTLDQLITEKAQDIQATIISMMDQVGKKSIFGNVVTRENAMVAIRNQCEQLIKITKMDESAWEKRWAESEAELIEADHLRHSMLWIG